MIPLLLVYSDTNIAETTGAKTAMICACVYLLGSGMCDDVCGVI